MSDYIDPRTRPWGALTEEVWAWMKAQWEATVSTHSVPDTEENRIREYRAVTQWFRQKFPAQRAYSLEALKDWIKGRFDQHKVDQLNNRGQLPRTT